MTHLILCLALCWLALAMPGQAQGPVVVAQWQIMERAEPPTVGEVVALRLLVSHPPDVTIELPALPTPWGDLEVRAVRPRPQEAGANDLRTTITEIDAVLWSVGAHSVPPMNIAYRDAQGARQELYVEPVTIVVASVLQEDDLEKRDLKPQAEIARPPTWPYLLAGALAVIGLGLFAHRWLDRRRQAPRSLAAQPEAVDPRSPAVIALEELERIELLALAERGEFRRYYSLMSSCIREYVQRRFQVLALDLTTHELMASLAGADLSPELRGSLDQLLTDADLAKFARWAPSLQDARHGLALARSVVRLTAPVSTEETTIGSAETSGIRGNS